jgi:predicted dehydrogenase
LTLLIDSHFIKKDGGYNALVKDENVQIVYIANVHAFRRSTVEMCLMTNKNVLVEKPFACSVADGEYLMGLANERGLFIMEVRFYELFFTEGSFIFL